MAEQNLSKTEVPKMTTERLWLIVSGVAAVVTVIVTVALAVYGFYFTHHEASKGIEATVISRSQLLNPEVLEKPSELHLLYKNHEVFDIGILQIRIRNSGAQPIAKVDIEEPITIEIEGATEIISAPVVATRPPNLPIEATISGTKVELSKTLLNPDDALTVEIDAITSEGSKLDISQVSARVAGVRDIVFHKSLPERSQTPNDFLWGVITGALAIPIGVLLGGALGWTAPRARLRAGSSHIRQPWPTAAS
jgi:hypothetical protein